MAAIISASIIGADYLDLGGALKQCKASGVDHIHFDMMDGHYVPALSVGTDVCRAIARGCDLPIDAHLMVTNPEHYIKEFAEIGVRCCTVHPETCNDLAATIQLIKANKMQVGLAFNPNQDFNLAADYLADIDLILLMSVYPGYCGQKFIPETLDKIKSCRKMINASNRKILLGVDGGIKVDNIANACSAGADFFVMGSGLFAAADMLQTMLTIKRQLGL
jgi:ribulose-phosphate 3-epimerase